MKSSAKRRNTSPKKDMPSPHKPQYNEEYESALGMQQENQNLQFAIGDRDIEIDRMKTTLIALNEKLTVQTDIRKDVGDTRQSFAGSEDQRN